MSDETRIRAALRRARGLEQSPQAAIRLRDHAMRVAQGEVSGPRRQVSLVAVAASVVVFGLLAGGAVKIVQNRAAHLPTPPGSASHLTPPSAAASSTPTPPLTAAGTPTPAPTTRATSSATAAATTSPTPSVPACGTSDVQLTFTTGGRTTYVQGESVPIGLIARNVAAHACQLAATCYDGWRVYDPNGNIVFSTPATAACAINAQGPTLQPGQTVSAAQEDWRTSATRTSPGTYTVRGNWGDVTATAVQLTITGTTTTTTSTSSSSSSTPILP